jgi:hypothetical protein
LTNVLGFDIGGANTKVAFVQTEEGLITSLKTATEYFPVWKDTEKLGAVLLKLKDRIAGSVGIDCVGITMTAELADSYKTKREGVTDILVRAQQAFPSTETMVLNTDGQILPLCQAKMYPLAAAAANWMATGWMVSQLTENCIVVDVGSTTTSIIPILEGEVVAKGKTDLEKLMNGELVYTGSLRTNVAAIVDSVPIRYSLTRISSELFAQSGDVHLILSNITEDDYTVETADGKGKTRADALARLARVVCADTEMLSEEDIVQMAKYIYGRQIEQVTSALAQVSKYLEKSKHKRITIVVTGLGRKFIAMKAAQQLGFDKIVDLEELVRNRIAKASTAVGVALMTVSKIEGNTIKWMP